MGCLVLWMLRHLVPVRGTGKPGTPLL
jgi:hypothetical protein